MIVRGNGEREERQLQSGRKHKTERSIKLVIILVKEKKIGNKQTKKVKARKFVSLIINIDNEG